MAQMYEFLPNDKTSGINAAGNDVTNLTVPIVREGITEEQSRNNPRVSREEMAKFILADLDSAEHNMQYYTETSKTMPHLDVVYGLKARYYMWLVTETQCLSTTSGFNDISCWMWGSQMVSEDNLVKIGILNWASWMSNETSFGYSAQEPYIMISSEMYDKLNDTDFRKKMWVAPEGTMLSGQTSFLTSSQFGYFGDRLTEYASVKFRPAEGNCDDYTVGAATAYPLMRVEEMYFIEAEAAAHLNDPDATSLLTSFMTTYRDPAYTCSVTGKELVEEIVFQKRVELWGEGLSFFDIKRLDLPVDRNSSTNFRSDARFTTEGRPAWMNICIVQSEKNNNSALIGYENPDPTGLYTAGTSNK